MHIGLYELESSLVAAVSLTVGDVSVAPDPTANPTYRIYEGSALVTTGTLTKLDTGVITDATNASPIVVTDVAHGLQTGNVVNIASVGGNTAANGKWTVTRLTADTFSLDGSTGNGAYTSGGTWHVAGLYLLSLSLLAATGFNIGTTYQVRIDWTNSGTFSKILYFACT